MTDTGELDRIWREGLASAADATSPITDPTARVAERVHRRRRAHTTRTAVGVAATVAVIVIAVSFARGRHSGEVATAPPVAVVRVDVLVGGQLTIQFPGRAVSGQPPHVNLPHGVIRFEVRSGNGAADHLVIDGVPKFAATVATVASPHDVVTEAVRMAPGRYLMHSTLSGHAEAGEKAVLVVK
jgi:hypothetical protein